MIHWWITSQVTYVTMVPRVGNETLRPLGVATGNASSVTRVWRYICKNTIRWPATAHDVTTGATIIKGSPGEYIISFFVWSLRPKHGPKPRGRSVSLPHSGNHGYIRNLRRSHSWELELRPLGVATGNAIPTPPCWGECKPISRKRRALSQLYQAKGVAPGTIDGCQWHYPLRPESLSCIPQNLTCWVPGLTDPG